MSVDNFQLGNNVPREPTGRFSIAIPNYNHGRYISATIASVLEQGAPVADIHVSDNCSTDDSCEIVSSFDDARVQITKNRRNVGFANNLDRAVRGTAGPFIILLSADDLMRPRALEVYEMALRAVGSDTTRSVVTSSVELIDETGTPIGHHGPPERVWTKDDVDPMMSALLGLRTFSCSGSELLRRSVLSMRAPIPFCSTAYPRNLYDEVEGYGAGRLINPDKWFHWKLCSVATRVYFVDSPLFAYRIHDANQGAQQRRSGEMKHMVDEYVSCIELDHDMLESAGLTRSDVVKAFVRNDVTERGLLALSSGDRRQALRILRFGRAVYPSECRQSAAVWLFAAAVQARMVGPLALRGALALRSKVREWK